MNKPDSNVPEDLLVIIGRITGAHGLDGKVKAWSFAESPDIFAKGKDVLVGSEIQGEVSPPPHRDDLCPYVIQAVSQQKKGILLRLQGISNRNQAEALVGKEILIHREALPELDDDTWYWQDLYGLTVTDETLGELGVVETIFPTGASDMLVVKKGDKETLVPMHRRFVTEVDLEAGIIFTALPQGFE